MRTIYSHKYDHTSKKYERQFIPIFPEINDAHDVDCYLIGSHHDTICDCDSYYTRFPNC